MPWLYLARLQLDLSLLHIRNATLFHHRYKNPGAPSHNLELKVGDICLLYRTINRRKHLSTNTRVKIQHIGNRFIMVQTADKKVHAIPRIRFIFSLPFGNSYKLMRTQFPLRLAYCITTNKSQGL